jgi:predicted DNA-binding transcriptional regulator YafY
MEQLNRRDLMSGHKLRLTPYCCVCKKDVDKMEWVEDFFTRTVYATAYCHGDKETSSLSEEMIRDATITKGTAFMNKRIDDNDKAFDHQVEPKIGLSVEKHTEAKDKIFNKEQELFYRATDYRGS